MIFHFLCSIYWIPPECYTDFASAKYSLQADIWALATTIWEIFSRGAPPPKYHKTHTVKMVYLLQTKISLRYFFTLITRTILLETLTMMIK